MEGKCWKFGDNVNTDEIIPARYLNVTDPQALAAHCMEGVDAEFARRAGPGEIIVAGRNFGCGSSREHAPVALKVAGVSLIIADSYARIFYRNAFNTGLPILESPEAAQNIKKGDAVTADIETGEIVNETTGKTFHAKPIPPFMRELLDDGGLIPHLKKKKTVRS